MSFSRFHIVRWLVGTTVALVIAAHLQDQVAAETSPYTLYQNVALCLYNFAKYTEWPREAFADDNAPFVLAILGEDPFKEDIDVIRGKTVKGRKLMIKYFRSVQDVSDCHLLFICSSEKKRLPAILKALERSNVLTVAEVAVFLDQNGMINLAKEEARPGYDGANFDINLAAAERAKLKLDTQLLRLAKRVKS